MAFAFSMPDDNEFNEFGMPLTARARTYHYYLYEWAVVEVEDESAEPSLPDCSAPTHSCNHEPLRRQTWDEAESQWFRKRRNAKARKPRRFEHKTIRHFGIVAHYFDDQLGAALELETQH